MVLTLTLWFIVLQYASSIAGEVTIMVEEANKMQQFTLKPFFTPVAIETLELMDLNQWNSREF